MKLQPILNISNYFIVLHISLIVHLFSHLNLLISTYRACFITFDAAKLMRCSQNFEYPGRKFKREVHSCSRSCSLSQPHSIPQQYLCLLQKSSVLQKILGSSKSRSVDFSRKKSNIYDSPGTSYLLSKLQPSRF